MLTGNFADVKETAPAMTGVQATIRWLIGREQGAPNFALRVIEIKENGGQIPLHRHNYEHEIFVIGGTGRVFTEGRNAELKFGDYLFIAPEEAHGFENTGTTPFRFICVVPLKAQS